MKRALTIAFGAALAAGGLLWFLERTRVEWPDDPDERLALARERRTEEIEEMFRQAGVPYPPAQIFLRAFKLEDELELWARGPHDTAFKRVRTFGVRARSGVPGPKRKEGDLQVPEGFYTIDRFNPKSAYHLSLGIDYPNASDRLRATDPQRPGSDIFVHGGHRTIGCLPIGDDGIEALYVIALDAATSGGGPIPVHLFPSRMTGDLWRRTLVEYPQHAEFWEELRPALEYFERNRTLPTITVTDEGAYRIAKADSG